MDNLEQQKEVVSFQGITIDPKRFELYLDDPALSEEQRQEFLEAIFAIVTGFIDLGFGIHPVQQACEQNEIYSEIATLDLADLLESIRLDDENVAGMKLTAEDLEQELITEGEPL